MFRFTIATVALAFVAGAAQAEPLKLTNAEMDGVTAGFTVNGKLIASFEAGPVTTINAAATSEPLVLPIATGSRVWSGHINSGGAGASGAHIKNP